MLDYKTAVNIAHNLGRVLAAECGGEAFLPEYTVAGANRWRGSIFRQEIQAWRGRGLLTVVVTDRAVLIRTGQLYPSGSRLKIHDTGEVDVSKIVASVKSRQAIIAECARLHADERSAESRFAEEARAEIDAKKSRFPGGAEVYVDERRKKINIALTLEDFRALCGALRSDEASAPRDA